MSVVVLKVGGASTGGVAEAVAELRAAGSQVCVVHGAGPQISEEMERRGLVPHFVGGRRVTTPEVLEVVCESFAEVNAAVCAAIGADAVGLSGDEIGPVVSPLAPGPLNVNADEAASALAVGIGAARIHFLTDVPGVFHHGELMQSITAARAERLVDAGSFEGGIVPKVLAAARAARSGLVAEIGATAVVA